MTVLEVNLGIEGVFYDPAKAEIIIESIEPWTFSTTTAGREEALEKALQRASADIDLED